ncbi:hypothetical protein EMIT0215P_30220 [Pseudomonas serboccidentalis]
MFEAGISVLGFVIQRGVEVGALLQVFLGVALGVGFFAGDFNVGTGGQRNGGGNGGSGDDGEEIEVHGGNPRVRLACFARLGREANLTLEGCLLEMLCSSSCYQRD